MKKVYVELFVQVSILIVDYIRFSRMYPSFCREELRETSFSYGWEYFWFMLLESLEGNLVSLIFLITILLERRPIWLENM